MSYKVYGLTEPGEDAPDGIRYIGFTRSDLEKRLRNHISTAKKQLHTERCQWLQDIRNRGERPGIVLLAHGGHGGLMRFIETFYAFRFEQWGNNLVNDFGVWTGDGGKAARKFASKLNEVQELDETHYKEIVDYYFFKLAPKKDREWYLELIDNG